MAPVTTAVRPSSEPGSGSAGQVGRRRRTAGPIRVKPGATVRSSSVSIADETVLEKLMHATLARVA